VEIVCTDSVMPVTPMALLRKNFPFIMSFIQKNNVQKAENNQISQRRVAIQSNNSEKIFEQFIQELYGENACEDELVKKEKEVFLTETKNYSWEVSK
jgi:predicted transcriptional regulator